jgi:hypothetical protein
MGSATAQTAYSVSTPGVEGSSALSTRLGDETGNGAGRWALSYYPDCAEATIAYAPRREPTTPPREPDREANAERAERRAKTTIRRWCVANNATRLLTLTYRDADLPDDVAGVKRDIHALRKRMPSGVALLTVIERGKNGTKRFHVHAAVSRYVDERVISAAWGHGFVSARGRSAGNSMRERARSTAGYLAKYVGKEALQGGYYGHRYEVTQGTQPVRITLRTWQREDAYRAAIALADGEVPAEVWDSASSPSWRGPPVLALAWNG